MQRVDGQHQFFMFIYRELVLAYHYSIHKTVDEG